MNNGRKLSIGLFWMIGSLSSFIGMAIASRELSGSMGTFEILFFRSLVGLIIILPLMRRNVKNILHFSNFNVHLIRNITHFAAQYCWTVGVIFLPLVEVFALEFTMPIWVALLAYLFLGEKISQARMVAVIGGFLGILIILRPGISIVDPVSVVVLIAALGYAISVILVKRLASTCSSVEIVFWMSIIQLPMGLIPSLFQWSTPTLNAVPWIIVLGLTGLSAHYTMAQALKLMDASLVIPIDFLRVPLIALVGYLLYNEGLNVWVIVGVFTILASNFFAIQKELGPRLENK